MTVLETLVQALSDCNVVDLSRDVNDHAKGPFQTRLDVLEPEPGAKFFLDRVLPQVLPEAVGRISPSDFVDGAHLRHEYITLSTHAGSHVDAPGHYGPSALTGEREINEAPLSLFMAPGVRVDVSQVPGDVVELDAFAAIRRATGVTDVGGRVVLIHTGGKKALAGAVVESLLDEGCRVIGVDSESFDGPIRPQLERFLATRDSGALWPCHVLGRRRPYYQLERLANLDTLPAQGFFVFALPVRIAGATAAWTRAVAFVPKN